VVADDGAFLFRYANAQNPNDPRSVSMEFFKEELERRSGGRIKVENYFGGILGTEREIADAVAIGALQATRGGMFEDASIKFNIVLLPYLVGGWDEAICLARSPWMMEIAAEGRTRGFHIPAVGISQGFRAHGSKRRAIRTVADFDGLKIRVPNAQEVFHRMENALGANPQGIAQSETYSGLRTGVVDGTTAPPSDLWDRRQYEVLEWVTIDTHATGPDPLMVNLAWYQQLPTDLRVIFDEVARQALEYSDELYSASEEKIIADLAEHVEIIYPTPEVRAEMRERTRPVYDFFVDRGDFTWADIEAAVAASKSCLISSSRDSSLETETRPSQPVTLSTATPSGDAYSWNDGGIQKPVILSERGESKNLPKLSATPKETRYSDPRGTLRLARRHSLAQGDSEFFIGSEGVRRPSRRVPGGNEDRSSCGSSPNLGGSFDSATSEVAPLRMTGSRFSSEAEANSP